MSDNDISLDVGLKVGNAQQFQNEIVTLANSASKRIKIWTPSLGRIKGELGEFEKSLAASNARVIAFGVSAGAIFAVNKAFKDTISTAIDVEKQLTEISVIMGRSTSNMTNFSTKLFDIADKMGGAFNDASKAALELARQGLNMEEALKRTSDAMLLSRLSGQAVEESVMAITAAINSFNKEAIDSTRLVNQMAAADMNFSVSSKDIAEAIRRVGSTASDAGVSIEELMAAVTAAQHITAAGGAKIGQAFKTIFTKIERPKVLELLNQVGVVTKNLDGTIKPAISILSELSSKFDDLSDAQRSQVAEAVGGIYQMNILKATLRDVGKEYSYNAQALKIISSATDEANERNEELNKTLAAQLQRGKNLLTQSAAQFGQTTFTPAIRKVLNTVEATKDTKGPATGAVLGGLSRILSGPGISAGVMIIAQIMQRLVTYAADATKQIAGLNGGLQKKAELQQLAAQFIEKELFGLDAEEAKLKTIISLRADFLRYLDATIKKQEISAKLSEAVSSGTLGMSISSSGVIGGFKYKAGGYIPEDVERNLASLGGYTAGDVRSRMVDGKRIVYNTAEQVIPFGDSAFIIPPKGSQARKQYENKLKRKGINPDIFHAEGYAPGDTAFGDIGLGLLAAGTQIHLSKHGGWKGKEIAKERELLSELQNQISEIRKSNGSQKEISNLLEKEKGIVARTNLLQLEHDKDEARRNKAFKNSFLVPLAGGAIEGVAQNAGFEKTGRVIGEMGSVISNAAMAMYAIPGPLGIAAAGLTLALSGASKVYHGLSDKGELLQKRLDEQRDSLSITQNAVQSYAQVFNRLTDAYKDQSTSVQTIAELQKQFAAALLEIPEEYRAQVASAGSAIEAQNLMDKALSKKVDEINQLSFATSLGKKLDAASGVIDTHVYNLKTDSGRLEAKNDAAKILGKAYKPEELNKRIAESNISSPKDFNKLIQSAREAGEISGDMAQSLVRFGEAADGAQGFFDNSRESLHALLKELQTQAQQTIKTTEAFKQLQVVRQAQAQSELQLKLLSDNTAESIKALSQSILSLSSRGLAYSKTKTNIALHQTDIGIGSELEYANKLFQSPIGGNISNELKEKLSDSFDLLKVQAEGSSKFIEENNKAIQKMFSEVEEAIKNVSGKAGASIPGEDESKSPFNLNEANKALQNLGNLYQTLQTASPDEVAKSLQSFIQDNNRVLSSELEVLVNKNDDILHELTATKAQLNVDFKEQIRATIRNNALNEKARQLQQDLNVFGGGKGYANPSASKEGMSDFIEGINILGNRNKSSYKGYGAVQFLKGYKGIFGSDLGGESGKMLKDIAVRGRGQEIQNDAVVIANTLRMFGKRMPKGSIEQSTFFSASADITKRFTGANAMRIARNQIENEVPLSQMPSDIAKQVELLKQIDKDIVKGNTNKTLFEGEGAYNTIFSGANVQREIAEKQASLAGLTGKQIAIRKAGETLSATSQLIGEENYSNPKNNKILSDFAINKDMIGALKFIAQSSSDKGRQDRAKDLLNAINSSNLSKEIIGLMGDTSRAGERAANAVEGIYRVGTSGHSLDTHDHTAEDLLKDIKQNTSGTSGGGSGGFNSGNTTKDFIGKTMQLALAGGMAYGGVKLGGKFGPQIMSKIPSLIPSGNLFNIFKTKGNIPNLQSLPVQGAPITETIGDNMAMSEGNLGRISDNVSEYSKPFRTKAIVGGMEEGGSGERTLDRLANIIKKGDRKVIIRTGRDENSVGVIKGEWRGAKIGNIKRNLIRMGVTPEVLSGQVSDIPSTPTSIIQDVETVKPSGYEGGMNSGIQYSNRGGWSPRRRTSNALRKRFLETMRGWRGEGAVIDFKPMYTEPTIAHKIGKTSRFWRQGASDILEATAQKSLIGNLAVRGVKWGSRGAVGIASGLLGGKIGDKLGGGAIASSFGGAASAVGTEALFSSKLLGGAGITSGGLGRAAISGTGAGILGWFAGKEMELINQNAINNKLELSEIQGDYSNPNRGKLFFQNPEVRKAYSKNQQTKNLLSALGNLRGLRGSEYTKSGFLGEGALDKSRQALRETILTTKAEQIAKGIGLSSEQTKSLINNPNSSNQDYASLASSIKSASYFAGQDRMSSLNALETRNFIKQSRNVGIANSVIDYVKKAEMIAAKGEYGLGQEDMENKYNTFGYTTNTADLSEKAALMRLVKKFSASGFGSESEKDLAQSLADKYMPGMNFNNKGEYSEKNIMTSKGMQKLRESYSSQLNTTFKNGASGWNATSANEVFSGRQTTDFNTSSLTYDKKGYTYPVEEKNGKISSAKEIGEAVADSMAKVTTRSEGQVQVNFGNLNIDIAGEVQANIEKISDEITSKIKNEIFKSLGNIIPNVKTLITPEKQTGGLQ